MSSDPTEVDLSIIIPVYNECHKIRLDIEEAFAFLHQHRYRGEVIVVDDGSTDDTAKQAERCRPPKDIELIVVRQPHRGKGHAVRCGMTMSRGRLILFIDSGRCIPYEQIMRGIEQIEAGHCDIAHASRRCAGSTIVRQQTWQRRIAAWLFRRIFARLLGLPPYLTDSQTGLKIYRGEIGRQLYRSCQSDGFLFDAEIILRALRLGYTIREFPITWRADPDSRLRLRCVPFSLLKEAWALKKQRLKNQ